LSNRPDLVSASPESLPLASGPLVRAPRKPGRIGLVAIYLVYTAVVARTLASEADSPYLDQYLVLELAYLVLFTASLWITSGWLAHLSLVVQSALVLWMLALNPEFDFVVLLFTVLSYRASLFFTGRVRWAWVAGLTLLIGASLIFHLGFFRGLALALTTMAGTIVIPAYVTVNQETEAARAHSQVLLGELEAAHQELKTYASQVDELATIEEHNRLARELHDTVSQLIFSISLTVRSAQLLQEKDPPRLIEQLQQLKAMTGDALAQLRSLITQLRPPKIPEG
jgi:signal transduction histidine kinase